MIPAQAVEAAAKEFHDLRSMTRWDAAGPLTKEAYRKHALSVLEAAAPHMEQTITTRVEQVNLPNGSVLLTEQGGIFQHFNGYWFEPASSARHHLDDIALPATIIYRPTS